MLLKISLTEHYGCGLIGFVLIIRGQFQLQVLKYVYRLVGPSSLLCRAKRQIDRYVGTAVVDEVEPSMSVSLFSMTLRPVQEIDRLLLSIALLIRYSVAA